MMDDQTRNALLQAVVPLVAVPVIGQLAPMDAPGERLLVAATGLWLEVERPWVRLRTQVADCGGLRVPYGGGLEPLLELPLLAQWPQIAQAFEHDAQRALPNEVAACVVRRRDGSLSYRLSETVVATPMHVRAQRRVEVGEEAVVDLHSHPACGPFFSGADREDMGSEVVLAGVLGRGEAGWEWRVSLFARGHEIALEA